MCLGDYTMALEPLACNHQTALLLYVVNLKCIEIS